MNKPLVSVCCATYNHKNFIKDAVEGFLCQKTFFDFEIVINDDASTDGTTDILLEYQKKYPEIIKLVIQNENQFSKGKKPLANFLLPRCRGKYIALCEGDDYWTDPLKLQKQVDFLEANPEYVVCYHDAKIIDEEGKLVKESKLSDELKRDFSREELMKGAGLLTLTLCFRNVLGDLPEEFFGVYNGDRFLTSLLGRYGKGRYLKNVESDVYRLHENSIWSSLDHEKYYWASKSYMSIYSYYKRIKMNEVAEEYYKMAKNCIVENYLNSDSYLKEVVEKKVLLQKILKYKKIFFPQVSLINKIGAYINYKKCPLCGKYQKSFLEMGLDVPVLQKYEVIGAGKRNVMCKKCGSTDRERLIYLYLRDYLKLFEKKEKLRVLHIAPEPNISKKIEKNRNIEYIMGDNFSEGYHYNRSVMKLNVVDIPFTDNMFDLIICNHVLEHVEDDAKAMSELLRVLKVGGNAILQVPISNVLERTLEDSSITDPEKRLEMFGQKDHLRLYGKDYVTRLIKAGFEVEEILISKEKKYNRFCLNQNEKIFACKKR